MSEKIKAALIGAGIALAVAAVFAALFVILKGEPPIGGIPYFQKCSSDGECAVLECAECMDCHEYLGRCVYKLADEKGCECVEKETMPCEVAGVAGTQTCVRLDKLSTAWSKECVMASE